MSPLSKSIISGLKVFLFVCMWKLFWFRDRDRDRLRSAMKDNQLVSSCQLFSKKKHDTTTVAVTTNVWTSFRRHRHVVKKREQETGRTKRIKCIRPRMLTSRRYIVSRLPFLLLYLFFVVCLFEAQAKSDQYDPIDVDDELTNLFCSLSVPYTLSISFHLRTRSHLARSSYHISWPPPSSRICSHSCVRQGMRILCPIFYESICRENIYRKITVHLTKYSSFQIFWEGLTQC